MSIHIYIIAITSIISIYCFSNKNIVYKLLFNAYHIKYNRQYYRVLTHGFIHGSWGHLVFNMVTLYFFGGLVEQGFEYLCGNSFYARILFVGFYLSAIVISSIPDYCKNRENPEYNALGASGAISSVLFASILFAPKMSVYIFLIPIPIPAYIFAPLYLIYCYFMAKKNIDHIGHSAHFWGALYGLVLPILLEPRLVKYVINELFGSI